MGNLSNVDTSKATAPGTFPALPAGTYRVQVDETKIRTSGAGNEYLNIRLRVVEGEHADRFIFDNLNLWHPNEVAKGIAAGKLEGYREACGIAQLNDTAQLSDQMLEVRVKLKKGKDGDDDYNEVATYASIPTIAQSQPQASTAPWQQ